MTGPLLRVLALIFIAAHASLACASATDAYRAGAGVPTVNSGPSGRDIPSPPQFMKQVIRHRTAQVEVQRSQMHAQLAKAASVQAQLAQQKPWRAPSVKPQDVPDPLEYLDLSDRPSASPEVFNMDVKRTR